jgi:hypothetical protein
MTEVSITDAAVYAYNNAVKRHIVATHGHLHDAGGSCCVRAGLAAVAKMRDPLIVRDAADLLDNQPLYCEAHRSVTCRECPRGSDVLRRRADELERR